MLPTTPTCRNNADSPALHGLLTCVLYRFINNEWVEGVDKKSFEVINPTTEEVICSVSEATEKDVDIAVSAARTAFEGIWKKVSPSDRGKMMLKLADLAEKNTDLLAAVESLDNGKSITMARGDVAAVVGCIRYYGGWADKIEGKTIDTNHETFTYTRPEPVCRPQNTSPNFSLAH
jgi:aldehyde dehydrogenase (NAD+)